MPAWDQSEPGVRMAAASRACTTQRGTVPRYPSSLYTLADNSYPFLLSLDDYFDFYWRTRWRAEAGYRLAQHSVLTLAFNREQHRSLRKETDFSFCRTQSKDSYVYKHLCADRDLTYRSNPPIRAGRMTSLELVFDLGGLDPKAWHRTRLAAEYSDEWMGSFARFAPPRCPARLARTSQRRACSGRPSPTIGSRLARVLVRCRCQRHGTHRCWSGARRPLWRI